MPTLAGDVATATSYRAEAEQLFDQLGVERVSPMPTSPATGS